MSTVVGRAYVTVRAITRQVGDDIQSGLDKALGDVDAKNKGTDLGGHLGDGIKEGVDKSDPGGGVKKSLDKHNYDSDGREIGDRLGQAIGESLFGPGPVSRAFTNLRSRFNNDAEKEGKPLGAKLGEAVGKNFKIALIGGIGLPVISDAIVAVEKLTAGAVGIVGSLGPTLATSAAVGGAAMLSLISTVGLLTAALKTPGPELDAFKSRLRPLRDDIRGIGHDVQGILLPQLEAAGQRAFKAIGPEIDDGAKIGAAAIGRVVNKFADLAQTARFQSNFGRILRTNSVLMNDFGTAGVHAVSAVTTLGAASGPSARRFGGWVDQVTRSIDSQLKSAQASGKLNRFFSEGANLAAAWGHIIGNAGGAVVRIFGLGINEGGRLIGQLEGLTKKWDDWAHSVEGTRSIREWFVGSDAVMSAFGRALDGLIIGVRNWGSDTDSVVGTLDTLANILPAVGTVLGQASAVARDFIQAIGPGAELLLSIASATGKFVVPALDEFNSILDKLPSGVVAAVGAIAILRIAMSALSSSEGKAGAAFTGLRTKITGIKSAVGEAEGVGGKLAAGFGGAASAIGPLGIALGIGTAALGFYAQKQAEAKARIDEVAQSLNQQTGAVTNNTRALIAKRLVDDGTIESAKRLGLSLPLVTSAALGNKSALEQVNAVTRPYLQGVGARVGASGEEANAAHTVNNALGQQSGELRTAAQRTRDAAAASKPWEGALGRTATKADAYRARLQASSRALELQSGGMHRATASARQESQAIQGLTRSTITYHDAQVKMIQGNIGLKQAEADAAKQIRGAKKTLDINSQAGRDNKLALVGIATAASQVTGSAKRQSAALADGRKKIIDLAQASGDTKKQAEDLANRLISVDQNVRKIPDSTSTKINTPGLDSAISGVQNYKTQLSGIPTDKYTTIHQSVVSSGGKHAGGGWINGPGTGTSDSIQYGNDRVSNREFIVNARAAAANAPLIEAINAGKDVSTARGVTYNIINNIMVQNPRTERTSDSIPRALRRARDLGIIGSEAEAS